MIRFAIPALMILAQPVAAQDMRRFSVGGEMFAEDDILDARGLPSIDGAPTIMITFSDAAAARFKAVTQRHIGKPIPVTLDGKTLTAPATPTPIDTGVTEISGLSSLQDAITAARLISGKEPLPDSLEEAP